MMRATLFCLLGIGIFAAGCVHYERHETSESRSISVGAATEARVQVDMGAGDLRIDGGASQLLDADFRYDVLEWRPEVRYDVTSGRGFLTVRQPPVRGFSTGNNDNRWDLRLNDKVPIDLRVQMGAGEGNLRLSGTNVRRLEVRIGAGELRLDLRGPWDNDLEGSIHGGVGEATVRLPHEAGVRVSASGGIGGIHTEGLRKEGGYYVNDAYGKSPARLRLDIHGGIGQINLIG